MGVFELFNESSIFSDIGSQLPFLGKRDSVKLRRYIATRNQLMKIYKIASIPGDGIGKEVIPEGEKVLEAISKRFPEITFQCERFDWGGDFYRKTGKMMPDDGLEPLRAKDAILFGSAGDPQIPDHITLWGLRLKICQGFDQYANVRPTRILPGIHAEKSNNQ